MVDERSRPDIDDWLVGTIFTGPYPLRYFKMDGRAIFHVTNIFFSPLSLSLPIYRFLFAAATTATELDTVSIEFAPE